MHRTTNRPACTSRHTLRVPPTTILFDLDGTLTDSYEGIANSIAHALASMGLPALAPERLRTFVGPPLEHSFTGLGFDDEQCATAIGHYRDYFAERGLFENRVYDGIPAALSELRDRGLQLAVATAKPYPYAVRILEHFDLDQYFVHLAGPALDGDVRPKADIIAESIRALSLDDPSTAVMVGDRAQDVVGAAEHGIKCLGVRWGYATAGELESAGAYDFAEHPADLPDLLT